MFTFGQSIICFLVLDRGIDLPQFGVLLMLLILAISMDRTTGDETKQTLEKMYIDGLLEAIRGQPKTSDTGPTMKTTSLLATLASLQVASANYIPAQATYDFMNLEVNVSVGNPLINVPLLVDTGSSETWFNSLASYYRPLNSATFVNTSIPAHLKYMDQKTFDGFMAKEQVIIHGSVISNANVGVIEYPKPTSPYIRPDEGYLGLGLEEGEMVSPRYPNILSQMRQQGLIRRRAFGVYIDGEEGQVLFGAYDQDRIKGKLKYTKMVNHRLNRIKDSPTPYEYDTLINSIVRNGKKDILKRPGSRPKCVETYDAHFDTGYTYMTFPRHVFDVLLADFEARPGSQKDHIMDCDSPGIKNTYTFNFDGASVNIPGDALVMNTRQPGICRLLIAPSETEHRLVIGLPFYRAAYVYFDPEGYQIGVAEQNKAATGNPHIVTGTAAVGPSCWINVNGINKCN